MNHSTTPAIRSVNGNLTYKLHQTKNWVRIKIINKPIRRGAPWDHNVRTDPVLALLGRIQRINTDKLIKEK